MLDSLLALLSCFWIIYSAVNRVHPDLAVSEGSNLTLHTLYLILVIDFMTHILAQSFRSCSDFGFVQVVYHTNQICKFILIITITHASIMILYTIH